MGNSEDEILFTPEQIRQRVYEMGGQISREYAGLQPVMVAVAQGALVFHADLIRCLDPALDPLCDIVSVSSYVCGVTPTTEPRLLLEPGLNWEGRNIIFVESIVDTGKTARLLRDLACAGGACSARICAFLDKPSRRICHIDADYVGFTVPDLFVVGYGLDYGGKYRNLPYIKVLSPEHCAG
jgi:hypoxanthine phosphoribosyltransferase